jgi:hypothetical protein
MERPVPQVSMREQRERTVRTLCEHFARDHLEVEEFEARLDAAHRAKQKEELAALVKDLPALRPERKAEGLSREVAEARRTLEQGGRAVGKAVRESRTVVAIMSGVERRGHWDPARRNLVFAVMGGVVLDFRDLQLPAGETEVFIFCMMGGVEILVPPDLTVDASGIAIMGGFEHSSPVPREPSAPVLRIQGFCMMGGVEVHVRRPGESAKDAQLRQREERRLQRERRRLSGETE